MAYYRRRRRSYGRRRTYRGRASYARTRFRRSSRRVFSRRRRTYARRRTGGGRTIRLVVQTVAASPLSLGMKGNVPVRRMF